MAEDIMRCFARLLQLFVATATFHVRKGASDRPRRLPTSCIARATVYSSASRVCTFSYQHFNALCPGRLLLRNDPIGVIEYSANYGCMYITGHDAERVRVFTGLSTSGRGRPMPWMGTCISTGSRCSFLDARIPRARQG
jgi:hypothetical protein